MLDSTTHEETTRIVVPNGPGMTIFSPDGKYGYVCSSFSPIPFVISVADHKIVGKVEQVSPFCPNIAATPDGSQVWFTLKDTGKVQVFDAQPPFSFLKTLDTGPITNHVNIVRNSNGMFAYVTVGALMRFRFTVRMISRKSRLFRSVSCLMAYGRPETARASMLASKLIIALPRSIR